MNGFAQALRERRRLAAAGLLGAATGLVLPLALAWACVPGAAIGFDRSVYEYRAGETVTVLGRAFAPSTQVALTLQPPSGPSTMVGNGVMTSSSGFFRDSFTLPASATPGAYVVVATVTTTDVDGHGRAYEARESFSVIVPPPVTAPAPPVLQPPLFAPALGAVLTDFETSLTLKARRHRRSPFGYLLSGKVRIPAGVRKAAVCGGRVKLRLRKGSRTVARGSARVSGRCTYKKKFLIRRIEQRTRNGRLRVGATFGGNAHLKGSRKSTTVRVF